MFLSSRWGKPTYEIEALPASEFRRQKTFWEVDPWGLESDLLAMQYSFYSAVKTRKPPQELPNVKKLAAYSGAVKAFIIESVSTIRKSVLSIASAMKDR